MEWSHCLCRALDLLRLSSQSLFQVCYPRFLNIRNGTDWTWGHNNMSATFNLEIKKGLCPLYHFSECEVFWSFLFDLYSKSTCSKIGWSWVGVGVMCSRPPIETHSWEEFWTWLSHIQTRHISIATNSLTFFEVTSCPRCCRQFALLCL